MLSPFDLFTLIHQFLVCPRIRCEEPERCADKVAGASAITLPAALKEGRPIPKEMSSARISVLLMLSLVILFTHEYVIGCSTLPG